MKRALTIVTIAALSLTAGSAAAFCRTSVCGEEVGKVCEPAQPTDCGTPIFWETTCVGFSVQRDASANVSLEDARALTAQAFAAWSEASCPGGGRPSISAQDLGPVTCDAQEFDAEARNANLIVFRDEGWPYGQGALALTTVTYSLDSGEIRDADIELNSDNAAFTIGDNAVNVDLLSILTHEVGHFLGLAHTPVADATMQTDYPPKSTTLRTLEEDDIAGICAIYPPGRAGTCDPEPINGLGDECGEPADGSGDSCDCRTATGREAPSWIVALGLAIVGRRRARRDVGRPR